MERAESARRGQAALADFSSLEMEASKEMRSMTSAPRDGTTVLVRTWHGDVPCYFLDCEWLRDGGDEVTDCWRPDHDAGAVQDSDVETGDALGWSPLQ